MEVNLAWAVGALLFSAGGFVAGVSAMRKDVDGVGGKVNRLDAREDRRHRALIALLAKAHDTELRDGALALIDER